jgi:hypothetical protein
MAVKMERLLKGQGERLLRVFNGPRAMHGLNEGEHVLTIEYDAAMANLHSCARCRETLSSITTIGEECMISQHWSSIAVSKCSL